MFRYPWVLLAAGFAAGLYYLTDIDRQSALAMDAVEWTTKAGFPLWLPPAVVALGLAVGIGVRGVSAARPRASRTSPPGPAAPPRATAPPPIPDGADWYAACRAQAEALPLQPVGEVRFDEGWDIPFTLRLRQTTMEQARRRIDAYVAFLHAAPTPYKARVTIESSPDITLAHHHLVNSHLKRRFPEGAYYVMEQGGGVDIVFANPDPRWSSRTR